MTPLHQIGDIIREALLQIPLSVVRGLFLAVPIVLMIWVLRMPREETTPANGTGRWDENLKFGACLALLLQVLIYSLL